MNKWKWLALIVGTFPENNLAAGLSESISGRFVEDVSVRSGGIIEVTFGGAEPDKAIIGKTLLLRPIVEEGSEKLTWHCSTEQIPSQHVPAGCR